MVTVFLIRVTKTAPKNNKYDGEDKNHDLRLTPGNVVFVSPLSVQTDASGVAAFTLLYGEQFAPWIEADITARHQWWY